MNKKENTKYRCGNKGIFFCTVDDKDEPVKVKYLPYSSVVCLDLNMDEEELCIERSNGIIFSYSVYDENGNKTTDIEDIKDFFTDVVNHIDGGIRNVEEFTKGKVGRRKVR